jgi:uncharacterized membrane protein
VFYPYLVYLILFNIYAIYLSNRRTSILMSVLAYLVESLLVILTLKSFIFKYRQNKAA